MVIGIVFVLFVINFCCMNDGLLNLKFVMIIIFFGLLLNILFNYIFIFGKFGLFEMGFVGCGIVIVIVNWVMFLMMFYYCYINKL